MARRPFSFVAPAARSIRARPPCAERRRRRPSNPIPLRPHPDEPCAARRHFWIAALLRNKSARGVLSSRTITTVVPDRTSSTETQLQSIHPTTSRGLWNEGSGNRFRLSVDFLSSSFFAAESRRFSHWNCIGLRQRRRLCLAQDRQWRAYESGGDDSGAQDTAIRNAGERRQPAKRQKRRGPHIRSWPIRPRTNHRPDTSRSPSDRTFRTRTGQGDGLGRRSRTVKAAFMMPVCDITLPRGAECSASLAASQGQ